MLSNSKVLLNRESINNETFDSNKLLILIREYIKSEVLIKSISVRSEEGTPQDGPLSPSLDNIRIYEL